MRVQNTRTALKINVKKTKLLRLGISEDEKVNLGNETIDQVDSFSYLVSIISKTVLLVKNFISKLFFNRIET